jgi:pimeloyl-ACP methyl ester carboxylesterase
MNAAGAALPSPSELSLPARARYTGAVLGDYALRTGLASAVTGLMLPSSIFVKGRAETKRLQFYAELADQHDAGAVFVAPPSDVMVRTEPGRGLNDVGGRVELVRFASPFIPLNPDVRSSYLGHERNATARAQHWRHDDGPRPTLCVIHGFGASPAWFNTLFFCLNEFFADGWDVVLFTIPFHGGRRGPHAPFNGAELFTHGFSWLAEAMLQAICDLRVLVDYLLGTGAPRIGVTGLSLGGYCTAMLASVEDRLDFAIPNAAVASMPALLASWFPANAGLGALRRLKTIPAELITRGLMVHSPLNYPPVLPRDRLMVVAGLGDRLTPPEHSVELWEHWDRPALRWFPGSHVLHFERSGYLDAMRELMATARAEAGADADAGAA